MTRTHVCCACATTVDQYSTCLILTALLLSSEKLLINQLSNIHINTHTHTHTCMTANIHAHTNLIDHHSRNLACCGNLPCMEMLRSACTPTLDSFWKRIRGAPMLSLSHLPHDWACSVVLWGEAKSITIVLSHHPCEGVEANCGAAQHSALEYSS